MTFVYFSNATTFATFYSNVIIIYKHLNFIDKKIELLGMMNNE